MNRYPKYLEKGMVFNRLTVLELDESSKVKDGNRVKPSQWKYKCLCECENTIMVAKDALCGGRIRSCGCLKHEKRIGKYPKYLKKGDIFNRLTVICVDEESKMRNNNHVIKSNWKYICRCECGNIISVNKNSLHSGNTKSCGCLSSEVHSELCKEYRKVNMIKVDGEITKIFFFNIEGYTIIDTEDYDKVKDYCWLFSNYYTYATNRNSRRNQISLHRLLMDFPKDMEIDHINGDKLDNRKSNLRVCTCSENSMNRVSSNTTGARGVYLKPSGNYAVLINIKGHNTYLGTFSEKQDAINVRQKAEIKYYGEFAPCICRGEINGN
jgi:hypothetical protein